MRGNITVQKIDNQKKVEPKKRDSSIELFRIVTMIVIVAHHYVVNSGLIDLVGIEPVKWQDIFLMLLGWGGKTGINCFILITGYFMCQSKITVKKYMKLFFELEFYNIVIYIVFLLTGYVEFSVIGFIKTLIPIYGIGTGFTHSYLVFYLLIPFVNLLIQNMNKKEHINLIVICVSFFSIIPTICFVNIPFNYVTWFIVIYLIAAFIRIYPNDRFDNKTVWKIGLIISLVLSWGSIILGMTVGKWLGHPFGYYFVSDSNKILAVITSICAFMFFKNLKIKYSKLVNVIASSSFGVLLIHSNSDVMRKWLWEDMFKNVKYYNSNCLVVHAIITIILIYTICTVIDILRIQMIEKPFFDVFDKMMMKINCKRGE